MAKALWKHDPATDTFTVLIPDSVMRCGSLDDDAMVRELAQAYGKAEWLDLGRRMALSKLALIAIIDSTINLAGDHLAEGDLSYGGALRWARNRADALVKAGLARHHWTGGIQAA